MALMQFEKRAGSARCFQPLLQRPALGRAVAATLALSSALLGCQEEHPTPAPVPDEPVCLAGTGAPASAQAPALPMGAGGTGSFEPAPELQGPVASLEQAPPPISGGTLLATRDGKRVVAADPDRDVVYVVDVATHSLEHTLTLQAKDEPGRLIEDADGRIHVALRGGRAVATFALDAPSQITRRAVCDLPRGLAYDAAGDRVHVACAEGAFVSMSADPTAAPSRTLDLGRDLRDVLVHDGELFVTRFRSAELLRLDAEGQVVQTSTPPEFTELSQRFRDEIVEEPMPGSPCSAAAAAAPDIVPVKVLPTVAWRALEVAGEGIVMLHQRARSGEISVDTGGYGSGLGVCGPGIVHSALSMSSGDRMQWSADLSSSALAVDVAVSADGQRLAVAAAGESSINAQVAVYSRDVLEASVSAVFASEQAEDARVSSTPHSSRI